jgi:hypothetical protein
MKWSLLSTADLLLTSRELLLEELQKTALSVLRSPKKGAVNVDRIQKVHSEIGKRG